MEQKSSEKSGEPPNSNMSKDVEQNIKKSNISLEGLQKQNIYVLAEILIGVFGDTARTGTILTLKSV